MGARYLDEEGKKRFREKRNKTMMEKYGVKSFTDVEKVKSTKKERYGDENYNNQEKHINTCLEKYGVSHHNQCKEISHKISVSKSSSETQQKYVDSLKNRYGVENVWDIPGYKEKRVSSLMEHYGVESPLQSESIQEKRYNTLKKNNTFNSSKEEEAYYRYLCEEYGSEDVFRQYSDERYPFKCDFYIKSIDKFIELNLHPSHNFHRFDETNTDDLLELERLKLKNDRWSMMVVDVWSNRDVEKYKCALKNNLNYVMIYSL